MAKSFKNREKSQLERVSTFAEEIAVKNPANLTYDLCLKYVDDIITVTDDEIATAILSLIE